MDYPEFLEYFEMDKERLKLLLIETQVLLDEMRKVLYLDPSDFELWLKCERESERFRAIKLALTVVDDTSGLSTIDFGGTMDVNKVYGEGKNRFEFNFAKR